MGWSGHAPALPASQTGKGAPKIKEHAMSEKLNSKIAVIGIDIGKNSFHIVGQDQHGAKGQTEKSRQRDDTAGLPSTPDIFDACRNGR
jgi:hypothetical protein